MLAYRGIILNEHRVIGSLCINHNHNSAHVRHPIHIDKGLKGDIKPLFYSLLKSKIS